MSERPLLEQFSDDIRSVYGPYTTYYRWLNLPFEHSVPIDDLPKLAQRKETPDLMHFFHLADEALTTDDLANFFRSFPNFIQDLYNIFQCEYEKYQKESLSDPIYPEFSNIDIKVLELFGLMYLRVAQNTEDEMAINASMIAAGTFMTMDIIRGYSSEFLALKTFQAASIGYDALLRSSQPNEGITVMQLIKETAENRSRPKKI